LFLKRCRNLRNLRRLVAVRMPYLCTSRTISGRFRHDSPECPCRVVSVKLRIPLGLVPHLVVGEQARESLHSSRAAACVSSLAEFPWIPPFVARARIEVRDAALGERDTCACPPWFRPRAAAGPPQASARCSRRGTPRPPASAGLLDRRLPPPVTLDDLRLKRQALQPRTLSVTWPAFVSSLCS
jgi:hypothetical protein